MKGAIDRIGQRLARKNIDVCQAQVHAYEPVAVSGEKVAVARVIASVVGAKSVKEVAQAINAVFDGRASCIPHSFREVETASDNLYLVGYVSANAETKPLTKEFKERATVIAKNVLMDSTDESTWDVKTIGGEQFICKQAHEDLSELLALACVRDVAAPTFASLADGIARQREYITYVDVDKQDVKHGYCIASSEGELMVVCRSTGEVAQVENEAVIDIHNMGKSHDFIFAALEEKGQKQPVLAADGEGDLSDMRQYYLAVYGYDPDYFAKFEEMIDAAGF